MARPGLHIPTQDTVRPFLKKKINKKNKRKVCFQLLVGQISAGFRVTQDSVCTTASKLTRQLDVVVGQFCKQDFDPAEGEKTKSLILEMSGCHPIRRNRVEVLHEDQNSVILSSGSPHRLSLLLSVDRSAQAPPKTK